MSTPHQPPAFLVGSERSGTTMLRLMLDHHPMLVWQDEFEFAVDMISPDGGFPDMGYYREWLSLHRIFLASGFTIDPTLDYARLIRGFLEQRRSRDGKPIVGATVHRHFDRLLHLWPEAKFIHLVRDPRDVARSVIAMGWAGNAWTGVGRWIEAETLWDNLCMRVPDERRYEVHYEQLLTDPARVLSGICQFLGVDYDPSMLSYPDDTTYEAPDASLAHQWKRTASPFEVRLVESRVGDLLARRGYEVSGQPYVRVGPLRRAWLGLQDWMARFRFRLKRYGIGLVIASAISRRLGWQSWHRRCSLKVNRITTAHLR